MNELMLFNYQGEHEVRTVMIEGQPWFVAKDVALLLGYSDPQGAVRKHCRYAQPVGVAKTTTLDQQTKIIPEGDVVRLVMRSKLPEAEKVEKWVCDEVVPTILKTGGVYLTEQKTEELLADPDLIIGLATQVKQLKAQRDEAIRTKAEINNKKTATACGRNGGLTQSRNKAWAKVKLHEDMADLRRKMVTFHSKGWGKCSYCNNGYGANNLVSALPPAYNNGKWGDTVHHKCLEDYLEAKVKGELMDFMSEDFNGDF